MFSQSAQQQVDKQAKIVYNNVMQVGDLLTRFNAKLDSNTRPSIENLDRSISELLKLCQQYQTAVSTVTLDGQLMPLTAMFMVIRNVIRDIEQSTSYIFKCKS